MNLLSRILALMLASVIFISLFVYQYFFVGINLELFIRDVVVFTGIYLCAKFLFGYIESIFELERKAL